MLLAIRRIAALASVIAAALVVPALASAAKFEVDSTGDETTTTACETGVGACTLRGAIAAANAEANLDEITFGEPFTATPGTTISLGSTLYISQPVEIIGTVTEVSGKPVPDVEVQVGSTAFSISAPETVIEGLGIKAGSRGVQILGGRGAVIRDNFISGVTGTLPQAGVEVNPGNGSTGNLIEGNQIKVPGNYSWGVAIQYGANEIFGNEIEAPDEGGSYDGCCYQGIYVNAEGAGNQIGGDTPESENVITNFWYGAIWVNTSNPNQIGRNRGLSTSSGFINTGSSTPAPTIVTAQQPKVTGTAEPGATVRVFFTKSEYLNEIEGFVGQDTADLTTGKWEVSLAGVPIGTLVTATETDEGDTSGLSATTAVTPEPEKEKEEEKEAGGGGEPGGGGSNGGGSTSGGNSSGGSSTGASTPVTSSAPPATVAPKVTITKGPAKSSTATTAKFTFKATPATGAKFECKLDNAKWAKCASPKTYKKLKPGKHAFQARATASGLTSAVAKFRFTVKA